jgi:hypothetical protein
MVCIVGLGDDSRYVVFSNKLVFCDTRSLSSSEPLLKQEKMSIRTLVDTTHGNVSIAMHYNLPREQSRDFGRTILAYCVKDFALQLALFERPIALMQ